MAKSNEPKRLWDNNEVIGEVQLSERTKLVVAVSIRDGIKYLNFREFYSKKSTNEWKPAFAGFCMGIDVPIENNTFVLHPVQPFLDLIDQAIGTAAIMPLYDETKAVYIQPKEAK
jgi:hypothetical protein